MLQQPGKTDNSPMTDLLPEAAIYAPIINNEGVYVDKIPSIGESGLRCTCITKTRATIFKTYGAFAAHCKTQSHIRWLEEINANSKNIAAENTELRETVRTQKEIITRLDIQLSNKDVVIRELLEQNATLVQQKRPASVPAIGNLLD